jgi:hypothetical protein
MARQSPPPKAPVAPNTVMICFVDIDCYFENRKIGRFVGFIVTIVRDITGVNNWLFAAKRS